MTLLPFLNKVGFAAITTATLLSVSATAQPLTPVSPAASVPRSLPPCGPVFTNVPANTKALCGSSDSTDGVVGVSQNRNGVSGAGKVSGVAGVSKNITGIGVRGKNNGGGVAIEGSTSSSDYPAALFTNTNQFGPHIWAGPPNAPVFEVKNDGRVFVQGTQIGLRGEKGERGERGERGDRGPIGATGSPGQVVRASVAVCGYTTTCGCAVIAAVTAAPLGGACSAIADNGRCDHTDVGPQRGPGLCCVCLPQ